MFCVFGVIATLTCLMNYAYISKTNAEIRTTLDTLCENNGTFPQTDFAYRYFFGLGGLNEETPFKTRYFYAQTDYSGSIAYIGLDRIASVSTNEAIDLTYKALRRGERYGEIGVYRYAVADKYFGRLVIFVDCTEQIQTRSFLFVVSAIIIALILLMLFFPVYFLTKLATLPVAKSIEKQRRFITDAGHEIKTPLAIISANVDVLALSGGEDNEWIQSIRNQTRRLSGLVSDLVSLSRMDEEKTQEEKARFSLSNAVTEAAADFEVLAHSCNKSFTVNVQPQIDYVANEAQIRRLVSILCDNAIKYSNDGGRICVTLCRKGRQILFEVYNTCPEGFDATNLDNLFERFYRPDSSRSRKTGGFGLGLSIAKATVESNGGRISVRSEDGKSIIFTVVL